MQITLSLLERKICFYGTFSTKSSEKCTSNTAFPLFSTDLSYTLTPKTIAVHETFSQPPTK